MSVLAKSAGIIPRHRSRKVKPAAGRALYDGAMRVRLCQALLAAVLGSLTAPGCSGDNQTPGGVPVRVFTHNLYLGSDLNPLAFVQSPDAVPATAATLWANVLASDYPARAKVLAAEIVALAPDLVALQEVLLYRRQTPSDYGPDNQTPNATEVALDFLTTLMAEIEARGGGYRVAGASQNVDAELPVADGNGGLFDLRVTDHDVILAHDGVATADYVASPFSTHFDLTVGGTGGVPISFVRSSSHLHATVGGAQFVFATGHLEIDPLAEVQLAQAQELVAALADVQGPLVLIGDFNSRPGANSYPLLTRSFHDAFTPAPSGDPGFTCCQAGDLKNPQSAVGERIDLILYRGPVRPTAVRATGADPATDRTPEGLWPSDHLGVLGELEITP
jgi:endonuclease/exonuclease/phosphatase family metal-dependent hydrolase